MKKKIIIISSVVLLIVSIFVIVKLVSKDNEPVYNIPEGSILVEDKNVLKDKKIGDLLINNVLLYTENNKSKYSATVNNKSDKDVNVKLAVIFYENESKTEIIPLNKVIKAKGKTNIEIIFEIDLTKITKIEYVLK